MLTEMWWGMCRGDSTLHIAKMAESHTAALNVLDPILAALELPDWQVRWCNAEHGWHVRDGHVCRGVDRVIESAATPLPGRHNLSNLCAALTAIELTVPSKSV